MPKAMPDLTPGQVAYTAYCNFTGWKSIRGDQLPSWPEVAQKIQTGWEVAAAEVLHKFQTNETKN